MAGAGGTQFLVVINGLVLVLVLVLLVLKRFRHLIVVLVVAQLVTVLAENVVGPIAQRAAAVRG